LPLGVALPPGVGLVLGTDRPVVFNFRTCKNEGCIAVTPLDDKTIASITAAKDGKVLVAGLDGKVVAIPISFKGYSDASRAYHGAEARRASLFWRLVS
jgi:invasion protein IalB